MTTTTTTPTTSEPQIIRPQVTAHLVPGTPTEVSVRAGEHAFTIDGPPALGGTDRGANPVEHLLAAPGSCQVISFQVWSQQLGLTVDEVEKHCPVLDNLAGAVPVRATYTTV